MTTTPINGASASSPAPAPALAQSSSGGALSSLDQNDFLRLMTVQMQHQDPFDPVDQKEMLAQMAQFSSLAGIAEVNENLQALSGLAEMNANLQSIASKLDAVLAAQQATSGNPATDGEADTHPPQE